MKLVAKSTVYGVNVEGKNEKVAIPGDVFTCGDADAKYLLSHDLAATVPAATVPAAQEADDSGKSVSRRGRKKKDDDLGL